MPYDAVVKIKYKLCNKMPYVHINLLIKKYSQKNQANGA